MSQRLSKDNLGERLEFIQLTEADRDALVSLKPILQENADALVDAFYAHLLSFEATSGLLRDGEVRNRLLGAQREYLLSLSSATWDDAYIEQRLDIGRTHERIGLEPRWYLGAYALYLNLLRPLVSEAHRSDPARADEVVQALIKVIFLDAQIAMDAYIEASQAQLDFLNHELAAAGRGLARRVDEQQRELRSTAERAEAAEQLAAVGTLAAGLAHEIGTPMGVIRGHAELLAGAIDDERAQWRISTILEQIDRITGVMNTLLNLARPRAQERAPADVQLVIETSLAFLTEKLRSRGIDTSTRFESVAQLWADAEKLQQLFINLFINAADAMPRGGSLSVTTRDVEDDRVEIRVRDAGTGIAASNLERIFEPFFTTKEAGRGSGLGLMVAKGIVEEHGGTIEVTSKPGEGTEFVIRFPIIAAS